MRVIVEVPVIVVEQAIVEALVTVVEQAIGAARVTAEELAIAAARANQVGGVEADPGVEAVLLKALIAAAAPLKARASAAALAVAAVAGDPVAVVVEVAEEVGGRNRMVSGFSGQVSGLTPDARPATLDTR